MLSSLEINTISVIFIIATIGIAYYIDSSITETSDFTLKLDPSTDILHPSDTVPEISETIVDKSEPSTHSTDNCEALSTSGYQCHAYDYRHEYWPSPRAVNFVKALIKSGSFQFQGRLTHTKAIDILASRAQMKLDEFLKTDPITYTKIFMPAQYTPDILLGKSIKTVENTLRRHEYIDRLRRHG